MRLKGALLLALPMTLVTLDACTGRSNYQGGGRREYANAQPSDPPSPTDQDSGNATGRDTGTPLPDVGTERDADADG